MTARTVFLLATFGLATAATAQTGTRDPNQLQDTSFARVYREWLPNPRLGSPLALLGPSADTAA